MRVHNLTEGNIFGVFIPMALPLILSALLSQAFHTVDMVIVGHVLGEGSLASLGGTSTLITLFSSLFWGLGSGFSLYIASLFGAGRFSDLANAIKLNLLLMTLVSLIVGILAVALHRPIFAWLNIDPAIYGETLAYYSVYMIGICIILLQSNFGFLFIAFGNTLAPLLVSMGVAVLNILGNLLFLCCTPIGVAGVALSSVLSALVGVVIQIFQMKRIFQGLGVKKEKLRFRLGEIKESLRYSLPCMLQQSALYLASALVQPLVNLYGLAATAGYSISMKVYNINAAVFQSCAKCPSNYAAQCLGAGKYGKIRKGVPAGLLQSFLFTLPVALLCYLMPEVVCGIFLEEGGEQSIAYAASYIRMCVPFFPLAILTNLFHGFFRGCRAMRTVIVCTCVYTAVRIAASFLLVSLGLEMEGIYMAFNIAWAAESVLVLTLFFLGIWRTPEYRRWETEERQRRKGKA